MRFSSPVRHTQTLVFKHQLSYLGPKKTPRTSNETRVSKTARKADFRQINGSILKTIEDRHTVAVEDNRKSHMGLVAILMILNDSERPQRTTSCSVLLAV